jgi:outer membrane protein assembly factor BamB
VAVVSGSPAPAPIAGADAPAAGAGGAGDVMPSGGAGGVTGTAGAAGAVTVVTTTPSSADWSMIGYDLASTYWNRAETVLTKDNAASLAEIWSADLIGNVYGAPLQIGDKIYASGPSMVRAYEAATGTELWRASVGSTASMSYADGTLYVNDNSGQINAINAADGELLWTKAPDTQRADGSSSPVVVGDLVLIGGSNGGLELTGGSFRGYLSALDRMTGAITWTTYTVPTGARGASIWSTASADLVAGRAYGSTGNNYGSPATDTSDAIIAFDLGSGAVIWKNQRTEGDTFGGFGGGPDHDFGANPVLYETMVAGVMTQLVSSGAKSGAAHAVRRDDGTLVWTRSLGRGTSDGSLGIFVNATWTGKLMLFACNEGGPATLYGLDGATGDIVWMRTLPGQVWGRISVANGVGFVGTGTTLEAFDVDTGTVIKSFPSKGGTVAGTISIANGRVAFGEGLSWSTGRRGSMLTVLALP